MPANKAELLKRVITCTTSDMRRLAAKAIKKAKEKESFFGLLFDWQLDKTHVWAKPQFQRELFQGLMSASPEAITIFDALFTQFYNEPDGGDQLKAFEFNELPVPSEELEGLLKTFMQKHVRLSSQLAVVMIFGLVWTKYLSYAKRKAPKDFSIEVGLDALLEQTAERLEAIFPRLKGLVSNLRGALQLTMLSEVPVTEPASKTAEPVPATEDLPNASPEVALSTSPVMSKTAPKGTKGTSNAGSHGRKKKGANNPLVLEAIKSWHVEGERASESVSEPISPDGGANEALGSARAPDSTPTRESSEESAQPLVGATSEAKPASLLSPSTALETVAVATNVASTKKTKPSGQEEDDAERLLEKFCLLPKKTVKPVGEGLTRTLGYAVRYGNFINCYGVAQWDSETETFVPANFTTIFPSFGAVNLKVISPNQIPNGSLWVIDWCSYDLQPYQDSVGEVRKDYVYQLDFAQLKSEGRVQSLDTIRGYPVVYPLEAQVDFNRAVYVDFAPLEGRPQGEEVLRSPFASIPVLLRVGKRYYGPFPLREDGLNRCYVNVPLVIKDGMLPGFKDTEPSCVFRATLQAWYENGQHAFFDVDLFFALKAPHYRFDTLTEEDLIARLNKEHIAINTSELGQKENALALTQWLGGNSGFGEQRRKRMLNWATTFKTHQGDLRHTVELMYSVIMDNKERYLPEIATLFSQSPDAMSALLDYQGIQERFHTLEGEIRELETRKALQENELAQTLEAMREEAKRANKDLLDENKVLSGKNDALRASIELLDESVDLAQLRSKLEQEVTGLQAKHAELTEQVERIESHLTHAFKNPQEYAFDGAIASKLISAASAWEAGLAHDSSAERAQAVKSAHLLPYKGTRLAEYLLEKVRSYRGYDDKTILNFFILLTQSFLTIFSGAPGVGKTSLCEILGHVLGLDHFGRSLPEASRSLWSSPWAASRFLPVSVERGWTSKRDFLGYYNPLSHSFESIDPRRREAFAQLDAEKRASVTNVPFVIMLDEANLSPMEYYWGDFMRIADSRSGVSAYIALGGDAQYFIPDTLRFVATINNDFTTENLSPRLLDRASIVTLPEQSEGVMGVIDEEEVLPPVSWEAMYHYFGPERSLAHRTKIEPLLERIYAHAMAIGVPVSMRTRLAILHYISAANSVFKHVDQPGFMTGIDFCVMQRLLPRINGNGEAYREKLSAFEALLANEGLLGSAQLLREVIAKGDNAMDWYRFF